MLKVRGGRIGLIFQEPMTALNPVHTIGRQLSEVFLLHRTQDKTEALRLSVEMLRKVGIPSPEISASANIPTNSPAACGSAWSSRWPSLANPP
jgi:ABC-type microcin C transport system duplicated ATPase subunit YejF